MADPVPAPRLCLAGCGHPEHPITMAGGCPADANGELLLDRERLAAFRDSATDDRWVMNAYWSRRVLDRLADAEADVDAARDRVAAERELRREAERAHLSALEEIGRVNLRLVDEERRTEASLKVLHFANGDLGRRAELAKFALSAEQQARAEAERVYTRRVKALRATVARLEHDAALVRLASDEAALRDLRAWLTYRADNLTPPGSYASAMMRCAAEGEIVAHVAKIDAAIALPRGAPRPEAPAARPVGGPVVSKPDHAREIATDQKRIAENGAKVAATIAGATAPACATCSDTHRSWREDLQRHVLCTACPWPCQECKTEAGGYCAKTPCPCACHAKAGATR